MAETNPENMFANATEPRQLIQEAVGASSMCWENVRGAGVFDDAKAIEVAEAFEQRLAELMRESPDAIRDLALRS